MHRREGRGLTKVEKPPPQAETPTTMFRNYSETGPALLTDPDAHIIGTFLLENTSSTIANTLRRCILTDTRSVGFRADLTDRANPGVRIRKNTSVIFNEMLAHRLTLLPLGVRNIDDFDPSRYEFVLQVKNERRGPITNESLRHVKAADFQIREKQPDGTFVDLGSAAIAAMFPADPITRDTCLLTTLRPQWNPEQPPEEIDLTATAVIGRGRDFMGFCPVSQCSFENTRDEDPVRQEQFFAQWLADYKKVADPATLAPDALASLREEWGTMAIQRCFLVNERGEPNSFSFTVESIGIRPVREIVAEGIRAVIDLVTPYANTETSSADLGIKVQPVDSRMNGVDVLFEGQEHTLGNLLQTLLTELYLDTEAPDSPITYAAYKVRHPLHRVMTLRLGIRQPETGAAAAGNNEALVRQVIASAAERARVIFEELGRSWELVGGASAAAAAAPELDG
jgi:DNA-directed RNA polymerase subunit L